MTPTTAADRERARLSPESQALAAAMNPPPATQPRRDLVVASDGDRIYTVHFYNGEYVCNCVGFETGTTKECRHIKETKLTTLPAIRDNTGLLPQGYEPMPLAPSNRLPTTDEFEMMKRIAGTVFQGGDMVPQSIKTPQAALAVMLAGHELGMPPLASLRRLYIVNGKTELETQGLMGLVRAGDSTAQFIFHKYDNDGADVELFRNGVSVIRCAYGTLERNLSKQGFKKKGQWKTNQNNKRYFEPERNTKGEIQYEEDDDSPWIRFPRDMYAYNAVKRCCRLGAPDLTNQIAPIQVIDMPRVSEDRFELLPASPLAKALASGEASPDEVFSDADLPADKGDVSDDETTDSAVSETHHGDGATIDMQQYGGLIDYWDNINSFKGTEAVKEVAAAIVAVVPYIDNGKGGCNFMALKTEDYEGVLSMLKEADERKPATKQPAMPLAN